eukprot:2238836-Pleurochrysis_carterae.AAC.1
MLYWYVSAGVGHTWVEELSGGSALALWLGLSAKGCATGRVRRSGATASTLDRWSVAGDALVATLRSGGSTLARRLRLSDEATVAWRARAQGADLLVACGSSLGDAAAALAVV